MYLGSEINVNSLFLHGYFSARYSQVKDLAAKQIFQTGGNVLIIYAQSKSFTLFVTQNISDVLLNQSLLANEMIAHEIEDKLKGQTPLEVQNVTCSIKNVQISASYPNLNTLDFLDRVVFKFCEFAEAEAVQVAENPSDPALQTSIASLRESVQDKNHFIPQCVIVRVNDSSNPALYILVKFQHKAQENIGYVSAVFSAFTPRIDSIIEWINIAAIEAVGLSKLAK